MELKPIRTDDQPVNRGFSYEPAQDVALAEQGQKVLRNTYLLLAATMVPTIIGAFIGMPTRRASGFMVKFLFVGMTALLIAMLANMFLQIPALALTISTLVIVVFSLFLLYDLNRIVRGGETNYILATTGVYISLFNIFANLLNILLMLSGERD